MKVAVYRRTQEDYTTYTVITEDNKGRVRVKTVSFENGKLCCDYYNLFTFDFDEECEASEHFKDELVYKSL